MNLRSPSHTMPASFHHSFKKASISIDKNTEGGVMKILRNPGINCQHQVILLPKLGNGNWTQIGQWILDPFWAVDTGPNLGSGYLTQSGQWILDPIWAVDTRPNLGSGF